MTMTLRVRVGHARRRRRGRSANGVYFVFAGRDATLAPQLFRAPPAGGLIHVEVAETIVSEDEYRQLLEHESLDAARAARGATEKAA